MEQLRRQNKKKSIAEIIDDFSNQNLWKEKFHEAKILVEWDKLYGNIFSRYTDDIYFKNKTIYIKINSSSLKNELNYQKSNLIEKLNQSIGEKIISKKIIK